MSILEISLHIELNFFHVIFWHALNQEQQNRGTPEHTGTLENLNKIIITSNNRRVRIVLEHWKIKTKLHNNN